MAHIKDIAIYGAGGFGREVACLIRIINESLKEPRWNIIGFFDDGKEVGFKTEYGEDKADNRQEMMDLYRQKLMLCKAEFQKSDASDMLSALKYKPSDFIPELTVSFLAELIWVSSVFS